MPGLPTARAEDPGPHEPWPPTVPGDRPPARLRLSSRAQGFRELGRPRLGLSRLLDPRRSSRPSSTTAPPSDRAPPALEGRREIVGPSGWRSVTVGRAALRCPCAHTSMGSSTSRYASVAQRERVRVYCPRDRGAADLGGHPSWGPPSTPGASPPRAAQNRWKAKIAGTLVTHKGPDTVASRLPRGSLVSPPRSIIPPAAHGYRPRAITTTNVRPPAPRRWGPEGGGGFSRAALLARAFPRRPAMARPTTFGSASTPGPPPNRFSGRSNRRVSMAPRFSTKPAFSTPSAASSRPRPFLPFHSATSPSNVDPADSTPTRLAPERLARPGPLRRRPMISASPWRSCSWRTSCWSARMVAVDAPAERPTP